MSPGYVYRGILRGELDPWAPKPKLEPKPPRQFKPCGTRPAYKRHLSNGEEPCEPCKEARRIYARERPPESPEAKAKRREYDRARWLRKKAA